MYLEYVRMEKLIYSSGHKKTQNFKNIFLFYSVWLYMKI